MAAKNHPTDDEPNYLAQMAIEQLLNRQEDDHSLAGQDRRTARRICGRWLLLRRTLRGLSRADVARRIKLDETTLGMLEMGLTDAPLTAPDVWLRLALVLEGAADDYEQVGMVIAVTLGQAPIPDAAWLAEREAELEPPPIAVQAETTDLTQVEVQPGVLDAADELIRERAPLPIHSLHVLRALRRAIGQPMSIPGLRKSIRIHEHVRMNVVDLRLLLERLAELDFVSYAPGEPSVYHITDLGTRALLLALRKAEAARNSEAVTSEFDNFIAHLRNAQA
jgi:transcriptional regulator with XRE-family HTH domain